MQNKTFNDALERKIYWLEKRIAMAQRDLWLFKTMVELTNGTSMQKKPKKTVQLELFTG